MAKEKLLKLTVLVMIIIVVGLFIFNAPFYFNFYLNDNLSACNYRINYASPQPTSVKWQGHGVVTFWFDDAWQSQYKDAFPILKAAGYKGVIAVTTGLVCQPQMMTWNQLRYMQHEGWEMSSHSIRHQCNLDYYGDPSNLVAEFTSGKKILEAQGLVVKTYTMPCGFNAAFLEDQAMKDYSAYRTTYAGLNPLPLTNSYNLHAFVVKGDVSMSDVQFWITQAKNHGGWLILIFHQVGSQKGFYRISSAHLKEIIKMVKDAGLQVMLPSQVLAIGKQ